MDDEPEPTAKAFYDMFDVAQKPLHGQTKVSQLDCSIPKIQILKFSQTRSKFKMNFKFHFKMFVCELISANKI
jgi:hypothetical protein